jgi:ribosomal protein S18 acetylase RimI-like enzyme
LPGDAKQYSEEDVGTLFSGGLLLIQNRNIGPKTCPSISLIDLKGKTAGAMGESNPKIEIVDFSDELREPIKALNYEWLEKYFRVEPGDVASLSNPRAQIMDKGGFIFYAKLNGEIVGTASLLKKDADVFEIGKMAVTEQAQGLGIGSSLLEHCLKIATQEKIQTLVLYSNAKLESAIHLYRKYGFTEVELEKGIYERANIKMSKRLS